MKKTTKRPPLSRALVWCISGIMIAFVLVVSWLDAECIFENGYAARLVLAGLYLATPVALSLKYRWGQAAVGASLVWALLILPEVRWNATKSFFVDARDVKEGMAISEVRSMMRSYIEVRGGLAFDGEGRLVYQPTPEEREWPLWPDIDNRLLFLHSIAGWSDHCEVWVDTQGKVSHVRIEKD